MKWFLMALVWAGVAMAQVSPGVTSINPNTTFATRTQKQIKNADIKGDEAKALMKKARGYDAAIAAYLKTHAIPEAHAQAMYAGNVEIGMHEEQISIYSVLNRDGEEGQIRWVTMVPWIGVPLVRGYWYELAIDADGRIVKIDRSHGE